MSRFDKKINDWLFKNVAEKMMLQPFTFIIVYGYNFLMYFKKFGMNESILYIYLFTVISLIILLLVKYKIIDISKISESRDLWQIFCVYLVVLSTILGVACGFFLFFVDLAFRLSSYLLPLVEFYLV
jgi:hypothetical protein